MQRHHRSSNQAATPHRERTRQAPSIWNAEGNPYMEGYVCCGKPLFGYWMGVIVLLGALILFGWMIRQGFTTASGIVARAERAGAQMEATMRMWSKVLRANWSMVDREIGERKVLAFLLNHFSNGPFDIRPVDDIVLKHGHSKGYALEYDEDEANEDAHNLYDYIQMSNDRVEASLSSKRRQEVGSNVATEHMDNRGLYLRGSAELVYNYRVSGMGRVEWVFTLDCKMRRVGQKSNGDEEWRCFEAVMREHYEDVES